MRTTHPLAQDLDHILERVGPLWNQLRKQHIFITGGTGFFGCWLLESILWANEHLDLDNALCILTRNPTAFIHKAPHLATHRNVTLWPGDVRSFEFPQQRFSFVIHAAAEADAGALDSLSMLDIIVQGTRRTLDLARENSATGYLLTSSGAIYGRQAPEMTHIHEEYEGAPSTTDVRATYGSAKRVAETLCAIYASQYGLATKIARCFAFTGAYLPMDGRYAIGNFVRDGLLKSPIRINSDGTTIRSYLYAADLVIWLLAILLTGKTAQPYNVGSEEAITIGELAGRVASCFDPRPEIQILGQRLAGQPPQRYVPSTRLARETLNLRQTVTLDDAILRTIRYNARYGNRDESN